MHRHHLGTRKRDAKRELPLDARRHSSNGTSAALYAHLTAGLTRPSVAAVRGEVKTRLAEAPDAMDPTDREVLALRHFEQLTNAEAAQALGIPERADDDLLRVSTSQSCCPIREQQPCHNRWPGTTLQETHF